jgi:hypothetical protein
MKAKFYLIYGKLQCYSSQSCSTRKTIGSKHLSENTLMPIRLFTLSQNICVLIWPFAIAIGPNQLNVDLDLKPILLSLSPLTFSPSLPNPQYLILSFYALCLIPRYVLSVLISHKKCTMFKYGYTLID